MDKKLFVSYARKDYKLVEEFIEASSLGSFDLWIDQHSQDYGDKWKDSIHKAIDSCNGAIIFVSTFFSKNPHPNFLFFKKVPQLFYLNFFTPTFNFYLKLMYR